MEKSADAFRTISEVATELDVPQHVLRFWESKFPQVKPLKRAGGRRYYRPQDVDLIRGIKQLLYKEGFTIRGVQRILKERGVRAIGTTSREPPWIAGPASNSLEPVEAADLEAPGAEPDTTEAAQDSGDVGSSEATVEDSTAPEPGFAETSRSPTPRLSPEDARRLREILAELERCAQILAAARRA